MPFLIDDPRPDENYPIRIAADGSWHHEGAPIRRPGLVRLFASVLSRDEAGDHWLTTPAERGRIQVDDAPFVAVELDESGDPLRLRTNLDDWIALGPDHPLVLRPGPGGAVQPYVALDRGLSALIARPVWYRLAEIAAPGPDGRVGIASGGAFFPLEAA